MYSEVEDSGVLEGKRRTNMLSSRWWMELVSDLIGQLQKSSGRKLRKAVRGLPVFIHALLSSGLLPSTGSQNIKLLHTERLKFSRHHMPIPKSMDGVTIDPCCITFRSLEEKNRTSSKIFYSVCPNSWVCMVRRLLLPAPWQQRRGKVQKWVY